MRATLTRTVAFRARHRLVRAGLAEAENRRRYGWTADAPGHDHDYRVSVTVAGGPDAPADELVDLAALDALLVHEVQRRFDGRHLNEECEAFAGGRRLPTCEALAEEIFTRLGPRLPGGARLVRVRVAEDATLAAECSAEG